MEPATQSRVTPAFANSIERPASAWQAPRLTCFGSVQVLTAGGSHIQ